MTRSSTLGAVGIAVILVCGSSCSRRDHDDDLRPLLNGPIKVSVKCAPNIEIKVSDWAPTVSAAQPVTWQATGNADVTIGPEKNAGNEDFPYTIAPAKADHAGGGDAKATPLAPTSKHTYNYSITATCGSTTFTIDPDLIIV
jgi:hypothetical protein